MHYSAGSAFFPLASVLFKRCRRLPSARPLGLDGCDTHGSQPASVDRMPFLRAPSWTEDIDPRAMCSSTLSGRGDGLFSKVRCCDSLSAAVLVSNWLFEARGNAGSLTNAVADVRGVASGVPVSLELSIKANDVDRRLAGVLGCCSPSCELEGSRSLREDVVGVGDDCPEPFLAVRPRTSLARSEADLFFDPSSSDERLDDIMVSSVPIALLFLLAACLLRRVVFLISRSSSDDTACNVGPCGS